MRCRGCAGPTAAGEATLEACPWCAAKASVPRPAPADAADPRVCRKCGAGMATAGVCNGCWEAEFNSIDAPADAAPVRNATVAAQFGSDADYADYRRGREFGQQEMLAWVVREARKWADARLGTRELYDFADWLEREGVRRG